MRLLIWLGLNLSFVNFYFCPISFLFSFPFIYAFLKKVIILLFILGCVRSSLHEFFSSCGAWASQRSAFPGCRAWALGCLGSVVAAPWLQSTASGVVAHGLSSSIACGVFPDHASNPSLLHGQVGSLPLSHQGSPLSAFFCGNWKISILSLWMAY